MFRKDKGVVLATTLPVWVQWAQATALIVISLMGAWIAFKQVRIAAAKLNLDLYEKRFAVFRAARTLLVDIVQHDHVDTSELNKFNISTADAVFLFDHDIVEYLHGLRRKALRLHVLNAQRDAQPNEERRTKIVDAAADQFMELSNDLSIMVEKFKPYLKLGNI